MASWLPCEETQNTVEIKGEAQRLTDRAAPKTCELIGVEASGKSRPATQRSRGNSRHITSQLRLENSLIMANEHSLCCRAGLHVGGGKSRGISAALVAKHKRKDQLIDKILIRAFDFNDRSVKEAAAPSPSSTLLLLKRTRVSFDEPSCCCLLSAIHPQRRQNHRPRNFSVTV